MTPSLTVLVLIGSAVLVFFITFGILSTLRRRAWIKEELAARAATPDEASAYNNAEDVPEVFGDYRPSVAESRHRALIIDDLKEIGLTYQDGRLYNVPAIKFAAGQKRADRQVEKLNRVRTILLATLDAAERRRDSEVAARAALIRLIEERVDGWKNYLGGEWSATGLAVESAANHLIGLLRRGPDPDANYERARKWCSNISSTAWQVCRICGHYLLDHKRAGGCCFPGGVTSEIEVTSEGVAVIQCACTEAGEADFVLPSKEPKRPERTRRRR